MVGLGLAGLACARGTEQAELVVFAAASLTEPFQRLGERFEREHPGVRVRFNFAGSQQLGHLLEQGARADLFAPADDRWLARLARAGLLGGEPVDFARNRLVVITPAADQRGVTRLQDLARPGLRLVLGAEEVPVGRYARETLDRLAALPDFGRDFRERVLANLVSDEDNVKQVVTKVTLGEADAGIVYRSDVTEDSAGRLRVILFPEEVMVSVRYQVAGLGGGAQPALARAFVNLLRSGEGQAELGRSGFDPARGLGP
jgi:molybdate transport system substrate-binding protein